MAHDYKVPYRAEKDIARIAHNLRGVSTQRRKYGIEVAKFIAEDLGKALNQELVFDIFDPSQNGEPRSAYVSYQPLALHVARGIWNSAWLGDFKSNYILAHELGHLLLHDHHAQAFSDDGTDHLRAFPNEETAEWQANTFAEHFLVPDQCVLALGEAGQIARLCLVPEDVAYDRLEQVRRRGPVFLQETIGERCSECNNFTMVRNGMRMKCQTCGMTMEMLSS